uniref:Uncharacterized protein n=1 Tax=Cajanus cajan TaxID=3821 RepID=A0A151U3P7_CAJCA|nr:hypothetical protein KK1_006543 [Cajanus cajan]
MSIRNGEHRNHPVTVSVSTTLENITRGPRKRSTAEISSVVRSGFGGSFAGFGEGNVSAKKERAPLGNVEMTWRTRGESVEGHLAWQAWAQRCGCEDRPRSWEHVLAAAARAGPSRRVRMWAWITSPGTSESVVAPPRSPVSAALGSPEVDAMERLFNF